MLKTTLRWPNGGPSMEHERLSSAERRLVVLETAQAVSAVHQENVADRLGAIEDSMKWLVRLVLGAVLMGLITYALRGGLMP